MKSLNKYIAFQQQVFCVDDHKIIPIRFADRYKIMKWRNEQIYHLRQKVPLTPEKQDEYFNTVITSSFNEKEPNQILFSFLQANECIGYGGLVHINWIDKNAEVSFIMNTRLEETSFSKNWSVFLKCLEQLAFGELGFHKVFIYAFDLRPHLYNVLESNGYFKDARLKDHCFIQGDFKDILIYSKVMNE